MSGRRDGFPLPDKQTQRVAAKTARALARVQIAAPPVAPHASGYRAAAPSVAAYAQHRHQAAEDDEFVIQRGAGNPAAQAPTSFPRSQPSRADAIAAAEATAASLFFPALISPPPARRGVSPHTALPVSPARPPAVSPRISLQPSPRHTKAFFAAPLTAPAPLLTSPTALASAAEPAFGATPTFRAAPSRVQSDALSQSYIHAQQLQNIKALLQSGGGGASAGAPKDSSSSYFAKFQIDPVEAAALREKLARQAVAEEDRRLAELLRVESERAEKAEKLRAAVELAAFQTVGVILPHKIPSPAKSPRGPSAAAIAAAAAAKAQAKEEFEAYKQQKAEAKARAAEEKAAAEAERKRKANEDLARRMRVEQEVETQRRLAEAEAARTEAHERREKARKVEEQLQARRKEMAEKYVERERAAEEQTSAVADAASPASGEEVMSQVDPLIKACKRGDPAAFEAAVLHRWAHILHAERTRAEQAEREAQRAERERKAANQAAIAAVLAEAAAKKAMQDRALQHLQPSSITTAADESVSADPPPRLPALSIEPCGSTAPDISVLPLHPPESSRSAAVGEGSRSDASSDDEEKVDGKPAAASSPLHRLHTKTDGEISGRSTLSRSKVRDATEARAQRRHTRTARKSRASQGQLSPLDTSTADGWQSGGPAASPTNRRMTAVSPRPVPQKANPKSTLAEALEVIGRVKQTQATAAGAVSTKRDSASSASEPSEPATAAEIEAHRRMCAFLERKDANGSTVLHHAIWRRQTTLVTLLLQLGAASQVNALDHHRCTPLHLACLRGLEGVIGELIAAGAKIDVLNVRNKTCYELPAQTNLADVVRIATAVQRAVEREIFSRSGRFSDADLDPVNAYVSRKTLQLLDAENDALRRRTMHSPMTMTVAAEPISPREDEKDDDADKTSITSSAVQAPSPRSTVDEQQPSAPSIPAADAAAPAASPLMSPRMAAVAAELANSGTRSVHLSPARQKRTLASRPSAETPSEAQA